MFTMIVSYESTGPRLYVFPPELAWVEFFDCILSGESVTCYNADRSAWVSWTPARGARRYTDRDCIGYRVSER